MFKNFTTAACAAIFLATLATASAHARQIDCDAPKTERIEKQAAAKKAPAPYFFLVLGVGY